MKLENLDSHCDTIHKKPKLEAGQKQLTNHFMPSSDNTGSACGPSYANVDDDTNEDNGNDNESPTGLSGHTMAEIAALVGSNLGVDKRFDILSDKLSEIHELLETMTITSKKGVEQEYSIDHDLEERLQKFSQCRSVKYLSEIFPEMSCEERDSGGLYVFTCNICKDETDLQSSAHFEYDGKAGTSFDHGVVLPDEFRHLKGNIKRHLIGVKHQKCWEKLVRQQEKQRVWETRNIEIGMRVARICYCVIQEGRSKESFEKDLLKASLNGEDLGDINHSKNFVDKFRPHLAAEVHRRMSNFVTTRMEQTGHFPALNVQADKGTSVHRTRQFITATTVVPDSENLINVVYVGQPVVKNHDGIGLAKSIKEGLDRLNVRGEQIEGGSFDGQYFHLSIEKYLSDLYKLPSTFLCTWDPLHRSGNVDTHIRKDASFDWLVCLQNTCKDIYSKFNWGKNYELLVDTCNEMEMSMKSLVKFHDVRFANSVRMVFINIREDFKPIVTCLNQIVDDCSGGGTAEREKAAEAAQILRSILNKKFCWSRRHL